MSRDEHHDSNGLDNGESSGFRKEYYKPDFDLEFFSFGKSQ